MGKKYFVFIVVGLLCSSVFAIAPLSEPTSGLSKGQLGVGVDYGYSKTDIELSHGRSPGGGPSMTLNNVKTNLVTAILGYGATENVDLFLRVGGGSVRSSDSENGTTIKTNSDYRGYALGWGVKATLYQQEKVEWGAMYQMLWTRDIERIRLAGNEWDAEFDMIEYQLAFGPSYQLTDRVSIYGGPFARILDGEVDAKRRNAAGIISYDIDEGSVFGGFIGTTIDVTDTIDFSFLWQHTASSDTIGLNLTKVF